MEVGLSPLETHRQGSRPDSIGGTVPLGFRNRCVQQLPGSLVLSGGRPHPAQPGCDPPVDPPSGAATWIYPCRCFSPAFAVSDGRIGHRSGREGGAVAGDVSKARSISASPTPHPPTGRRGPGESRLSLSVLRSTTRWPWPSTGCGPFRSRPERSGFRTTA